MDHVFSVIGGKGDRELGKTGEGDQGYKSSHRDITYRIVNNGCNV